MTHAFLPLLGDQPKSWSRGAHVPQRQEGAVAFPVTSPRASPRSEAPLFERQTIHRCNRFVVQRARWGAARFPVVVKTVVDPAQRDVLCHEHRFLLRAAAPGVVRVLALENGSSPQPLLVVEDAGSEDLKSWLERGPLAIGEFLHVATELASIVERVHVHEVVHGDIHPGNIVLRPGAWPTLIDFERASDAVAVAVVSPRTPEEIGEGLPYMSPEQTGRTSRFVDARSDLYSLGAVFYEMLFGAPPFSGYSPVAVVDAHLTRSPASPSEVDPRVPSGLSEMVDRLLAKAPEDRYQSATALVADLRRAQTQWLTAHEVPSYELAVADRSPRLIPPGRLYGRDEEVSALIEELERVRSAGRALVLLQGEAGVGKTALLEAFVERARERGRVAFGQCAGGGAGCALPYSRVVRAFGSLLGDLRSEPAEVRAMWRRRLAECLGPNASVLEEVLPAIRGWLTSPAPRPSSGPAADEQRLRLTFAALARALARIDEPLVIVLDDLHAVCSASLNLLRTIATDPEADPILLVGSYRPEDVTAEGPLSRWIEAMEDEKCPISRIELRPLNVDAVAEFCADMLQADLERVRPLAELVKQHSAGVPLYVRRLILTLQRLDLLTFDMQRGTWRWDTSRIERLPVCEHAVELLANAIRRCPEPTQETLAVAACIGRDFELELLARVQDQPVKEIARRLRDAINEALLAPREAANRNALQAPAYDFVHDRVQEVAYGLLPPAVRAATHVKIARELLRSRPDLDQGPELFLIVEQLERGADALDTPESIFEYVDLEARAGRRAAAASAHASALRHFLRGIEHLPPDAWARRFERCFGLFRDAIRAANIVADRGLVERLAREAKAQDLSALQFAEIATLRVEANTRVGAFDEAVEVGREGLSTLGETVPHEVRDEDLHAELLELAREIVRRPANEILDAPRMTSPLMRARSLLLAELATPLYFQRPSLSVLLEARIVKLALEQGITPESATGLVSVARHLGALGGDWALSHQLALLGVELVRRLGEPARECETLVNFALFVNHWHAPLRSDIPVLRRAYELGVASGGITFAAYARAEESFVRFITGDTLSTVEAEADAAVHSARRFGNPVAGEAAEEVRHAARWLRGFAAEGDRLVDCQPTREDSGQPFSLLTEYFRQVTRLTTALILGEVDEALRYARAAQALRVFGRALPAEAIHVFHRALAVAAATDVTDVGARARAVSKVERDRSQLQRWAVGCPENFRHMEQLLAAELGRLEGRGDEPATLYEHAIESAASQRFVLHEALANERAAWFRRAQGRPHAAVLYLRAARDAYARWGAVAKARALAEELPPEEPPTATRQPFGVVPRVVPAAVPYDLELVRAATEQIVGLLDEDQLIDRALRFSLELAGADKAVLALEEEGELRVRGWRTDRVERTVFANTPLRQAGDLLPVKTVGLSFRGGDSLKIADTRLGSYVTDPYLERHQVGSVLAIPIVRLAHRLGVLYVEQATPRGFEPGCATALEILCSQVAAALENGGLFRRFQREMRKRRRAEEHLRFLAEASVTLAESLDRDAALQRLAKLAVPWIADLCTVDVREGESIRRVAGFHAQKSKVGLMRELLEHYPTEKTPQSWVGQVIRTGEPIMIPEVTEELLKSHAADREHARLLRELQLRTLVSVPIQSHDETMGAITFGSEREGVRYGPADLRLAEELAARAALAIENARLYEDAREAVRLRDEFLSIASHELRGPLSALQLTVQTLGQKNGVATSDPRLVRSLHLAQRQTARLGRLVEELFDVTRAQSGRLDLRLQPVALSEVVGEVVDRFADELEQAGCTIEVDVPPTIVGRWDRDRLEQIVENLLGNALKFGRGKPIRIHALRADGTARLSVRDYGIGIEDERMDRIFDRFERGVSARHYGGLGLGLFIVRELAAAHGGRVTVCSARGHGSTFTVELPLQGSEAAPVDSRGITA